MDPVMQASLQAAQAKEAEKIQQLLQDLDNQVSDKEQALQQVTEELKPLNEKLAAATAKHTEQDEAFKAISSSHTTLQSSYNRQKKQLEEIDKKRQIFEGYEDSLNRVKTLLKSEDGYDGGNWYFPPGFKLEDTLSCFDGEDIMTAREKDEFRTYAKDSHTYHTSTVSWAKISLKYSNQAPSESPRLLLLNKVETRLAELNIYLNKFATSDQTYQDLLSGVQKAKELLEEKAQEFEQAKTTKEEAKLAFEQARAPYREKINVKEQIEQDIAKLAVTQKLYETYWKPINETLYNGLAHTAAITTFVMPFNDSRAEEVIDEEPTLAELVKAYEENKQYLDDAREIKAAYEGFEYTGASGDTAQGFEGFRNAMYADDSLNKIEEDACFIDFRDGVLEPNFERFKALPAAIEKMEQRQQFLLSKITAKQAEVKEKQQQATLKRQQLADKYLPRDERKTTVNDTDVTDEGRLDSYINQRNATYLGWDMFAGFIKAITRMISFAACCPLIINYEPEKDIRETYVNNLKGEVKKWRDGQANTMGELLAQKGQFKQRKDTNLPLSTLQQNISALEADVAEVNRLMPSDEDVTLSTQQFAVS